MDVPVGWAAGPVLTNPVAGAILADTGPLESSGRTRVQVCATLNPTGSELIFQWRDGVDAVRAQKILPVTLAMLDWTPLTALLVNKGDRFVVIARLDIQAEVEVSIFYGGSPTA